MSKSRSKRLHFAEAAGALFLLMGFAASLSAELTVSPILSDHAVIQRDKPVVVTGTADADRIVEVSLGKRTAKTKANSNGKWRLRLESQAASKNPLTMRIEATALGAEGEPEVVEFADVLVGDVWHASGQSNMAMKVGACAKAFPEIEQMVSRSDHPEIRFTRIAHGPARMPLKELPSDPKWTVATPDAVRQFSAAAFFFARRVHLEVGVPIGIVDTSRGGTPIEPYIPTTAFVDHPTLIRERELGEKDDLESLQKLRGGVRARDDNWLPGRLFHSRVAPITEFPVRGCVWYQAESNCGKGEDPRDYERKMRALINGWRVAYRDPRLPFYFVQLPGSGAGPNWPYMREQQRLAARGTNVGMVVTIDLENDDIHPPNKLDVGERLAKWALANEYGRDLPFSGPMFRSAEIRGNAITVSFDHAESGLMVAEKVGVAPTRELEHGVLNHFEVSGEDRVWHGAVAKIRGKQIVVSSDLVEEPVAVRYAYAVSPSKCNLFNRDGLPTSPFCSRTDLLDVGPGLPQ